MNATIEVMLGEVLAPVLRELPESTARKIVELEADERLQKRVEYLAERANEGELTPAELQEYSALVEAGDILATLQAVLRQSLNSGEP